MWKNIDLKICVSTEDAFYQNFQLHLVTFTLLKQANKKELPLHVYSIKLY